jgi:hypothetical protein
VTTRIAAAETREADEARRREEISQAVKEAAMNEDVTEDVQHQSDSDEDADIPGENEQIRALKVLCLRKVLTQARRRELKNLLNAQRPEVKNLATGGKARKEKLVQKTVKPGYTVCDSSSNLT